jgi:predicted alpha/beta-hydrolase family hydrolase
MEEQIAIETSRGSVSGEWSWDGDDRAVVIAHGAGNDMHSPLLVAFTAGLVEGRVGSLRFNFPYKEQGRKAPDPEPVLRDALTAAFRAATDRAKGRPVLVGGKSLGGRLASLLVSDGLPAAGLVFIGYPLHPPGKPERLRDEHLARIDVPMLFLQGTADPFARWDLVEKVVKRIGPLATLHPVEGGDHSFRVRGARKSDEEIGRDLARPALEFIRHL